jgi:hypothetical protein
MATSLPALSSSPRAVTRSDQTPAVVLGGPIALVAHSGRVFWLEDEPSRVMSMPQAGGSPGSLYTGTGGGYLRLAVDATNVYWTDGDAATLQTVPLGGGTAVTLASGQTGMMGVAIDAQYAYFTGARGILRVSKSGGPATLLASTRNATAVAVDDHNVYWITAGSAGQRYRDGTVMGIPK